MSAAELEQEKKLFIQPTCSQLLIAWLRKHWSRREAVQATEQYRNYLFLRKKYPEYDLPPS